MTITLQDLLPQSKALDCPLHYSKTVSSHRNSTLASHRYPQDAALFKVQVLQSTGKILERLQVRTYCDAKKWHIPITEDLKNSSSDELYQGEFGHGGIREGKGHLIHKKSKQTYQGDFQRNIPHGQGEWETTHGCYTRKYRGQIVNGVPQGYGWNRMRRNIEDSKIKPKYCEYIGTFYQGNYHGIGALLTDSGSTRDEVTLYIGEFRCSQRSGLGFILSVKASGFLEGQCNQLAFAGCFDEVPHRFGFYATAMHFGKRPQTRFVYEGHLKDLIDKSTSPDIPGLRCGRGTTIQEAHVDYEQTRPSPDVSSFEITVAGTFRTHPSMIIHWGEYQHGKPEGNGVAYWPSKSAFAGSFSNGVQHGEGCVYQEEKDMRSRNKKAFVSYRRAEYCQGLRTKWIDDDWVNDRKSIFKIGRVTRYPQFAYLLTRPVMTSLLRSGCKHKGFKDEYNDLKSQGITSTKTVDSSARTVAKRLLKSPTWYGATKEKPTFEEPKTIQPMKEIRYLVKAMEDLFNIPGLSHPIFIGDVKEGPQANRPINLRLGDIDYLEDNAFFPLLLMAEMTDPDQDADWDFEALTKGKKEVKTAPSAPDDDISESLLNERSDDLMNTMGEQLGIR